MSFTSLFGRYWHMGHKESLHYKLLLLQACHCRYDYSAEHFHISTWNDIATVVNIWFVHSTLHEKKERKKKEKKNRKKETIKKV